MFILKIFTYVNIYLRRAISCDMDILAQTNDTLIVSNVWFSKEFPEFIRYGKVGL